MCGIAGIIDLKSDKSYKVELDKMTIKMQHRGPDDSGVFFDGGVSLGHCRLAIIDTSKGGHQPMTREGVTIVFNGEIYNYKELRQRLSEYTFSSDSDTEVLIRAWQKWGVNMLDKLNGMFAFALFDSRSRETLIARDRMGEKPLYYGEFDNKLVFASEIRTLLESGLVDKRIDHQSLKQFLSYQTVYAPFTIIANVYFLMPGSYILVKNGRYSINRWWSCTSNIGRQEGISRTEAKEEVRRLMIDSINLRLRADVPFGAFLSGGIDSSIIVGLMAKYFHGVTKTFNVSFGEKKYSEANYAQIVAKKFETHHHEIELTPSDFLNELPAALKAMDHPSGDGPNSYVVARYTKQAGITMALSGLGGDELFGGYDIFKRMLMFNNYNRVNNIPRFIRKFGSKILQLGDASIARKKIALMLELTTISQQNVYPLSRLVLLPDQLNEIAPSLADNIKCRPLNKYFKAWGPQYIMSSVSEAEIELYMQNVLLRDTDQMSMAHALEVRTPFLDHRLVEFVLSLPDSLKQGISSKSLLVDAFVDILPEQVVNREKMGFTLPWEYWMKNELNEFVTDSLISIGNKHPFSKVGISNLHNKFKNDVKAVSWSRVWHLVVLENWMNINEVKL